MHGRRGIRAKNPRSYKQLEKAGRKLRHLVGPGCSLTEPLCFEALLERRGLVIERSRLTVAVRIAAVSWLHDGYEAHVKFCARREQLRMHLSRSTFDEIRLGDGRARFTMAHELAHCLLHTYELAEHRLLPHYQADDVASPHQFFEDTEWQADACASAALMPLAGLRELANGDALGPQRVAETFRVSPEAARVRLEILARRLRSDRVDTAWLGISGD